MTDDRRHAEQTRRLAEAQRIARLGSWTWDPDRGELLVSPELEELLRMPIGEPWRLSRVAAILHPDDLPMAIEALNTARTDQPLDHVIRVYRGDGTLGWFHARTHSGRDLDGRVFGTWQDVTEREVAEQRRLDLEARLQSAQRLESIGQLAGGVAHDFNNLLGVMGMQADLARRALPDVDTADDLLRQLQGAIDRATALTKQLAVFSRQHQAPTEMTDLREAVDDLATLLARTIGEDVSLRVDHGTERAVVRIDRDALERIVLNLVMNARDAMPRGGALVLRTHEVSLAADDPRVGHGLSAGPHVELIVSDTGIGMDRDVAERAFDPFFSTKPKTQGTGLGLSTVYGIVRRAAGAVEIVSEPGAGTVVKVVLPVAATEVPPRTDDDPASGAPASSASPDSGRAAVKATSRPGRGETVLVVEDQPELRQLLADVLDGAGYRVVLAADGMEALVRASGEERIDLLLSDVVMPRMSGQDLVAKLRDDRPTLKVLLMSGYSEGGEAVALHKPFLPAQLLDAVASALAGS